MKLSVWAKQQGISYRTAWRWFTEGKLPVPARQTPTGTILVQDTGSDLDRPRTGRGLSEDGGPTDRLVRPERWRAFDELGVTAGRVLCDLRRTTLYGDEE